ncbi:MAG: hypothetical protein JJT76_19270 [Clostridiaceae bacterium]|nr:hypothetical protein [Clostridiaceae bacterium]
MLLTLCFIFLPWIGYVFHGNSGVIIGIKIAIVVVLLKNMPFLPMKRAFIKIEEKLYKFSEYLGGHVESRQKHRDETRELFVEKFVRRSKYEGSSKKRDR